MIIEISDDTPQAWRDLVEAMAVLSKGQTNKVSPTYCAHDTLYVCADPHKFTKQERAKLDELGFFVSGHDRDNSDGDEGEALVEDCANDYCEASFMSFRFGSA
jgi:hypothetical protein